jgi:hypothetical protein
MQAAFACVPDGHLKRRTMRSPEGAYDAAEDWQAVLQTGQEEMPLFTED